MNKTIGVVGLGAIGGTVAKALLAGIPGMSLTAVSEKNDAADWPVPNVSFAVLAERCDLVIECLPAQCVYDLAVPVFDHGKDLVVISSAALIIDARILNHPRSKNSRIIVPSGAIAGIDGVQAMAQIGIISAQIASVKPPRGYAGAPFIISNDINLNAITEKTLLFEGNAIEAAAAFPANVNVAATLSLAGAGPERTKVQVWADPQAQGNAHTITVKTKTSTLEARIENAPDPANPKTSVLAAQSIIALLKNLASPLVVL